MTGLSLSIVGLHRRWASSDVDGDGHIDVFDFLEILNAASE
jgi:hypothetical protein